MSKPLRIGLVMQGGANWMGGAEYIKNIILALASLPAEVRSTFEICLLCDETTDKDILNQIQPHIDDIFYTEYPTFLKQNIWKIRRYFLNQYYPSISNFLGNNNKHKIDVLYPYFANDISEKKYRSVAWIPDFQHKYLPHLFTAKDIRARNQEFLSSTNSANTVVVSSECAKRDLCHFFPNSKEKVRVLPFTTIPIPDWYDAEASAVVKKYELPEKFFLVSNQFWQHKDHTTVFYALKQLQEKGIFATVVCTGSLHDYRNKNYIKDTIKLIEKLGISKQVYLLGMIPKIHQIQLLRSSLAVIQPSLFEGWSTIVEESRCFGKKIILSDIPVHLEQNPPNSIFFEKNSPENLSTLLANYWNVLHSGIDLEQELVARENNRERITAFALSFMQIIKNCT